MKTKFIMTLLIITMLLTSCGISSSYSITMKGKDFVIDKDKKTVLYNGEYSSYKNEGNKITITYPNGSTYWRVREGGFNHSGGSSNYDATKYFSGDDLAPILYQAPSVKKEKSYGTAFLLLLIGAFNTIFPKASWYISHGWKYKNAEPSDTYLSLTRFVGILLLVFGFLFLFV